MRGVSRFRGHFFRIFESKDDQQILDTSEV
jgi:hypothetical protein